MNMADAALTEPKQDTEKVEETRQRFKSEYVQDSQDKYDPRDVERLQNDDALVESYLTWRDFVVEDTLKMIDESFQWRNELKLNDVTESCIPKWMFETGAVYLHGYDKEGNKLFWFKVKLHVKDGKTFHEKKKYVAFWLERYAKREPGMPLTVVFDMSDSGFGNIDMEFVKYIITCFKVYYPRFLSKMVIYDMPWIMNAAWKIVRSWLGPDAINKLKFATKNDVQTYIDAEYLPPHMGGTDSFKYSYPPLPDDDFQSPIYENGPTASEEDENECKDLLELSLNSEHPLRPKKVNFTEDSLKLEEVEKVEPVTSRTRGVWKPATTFKGQLFHISPAEELCFGSKDSEKKCLIILSNVTSNHVAFKVRTTAPEKYRVKPSNSSCEPGASAEIVVSLHGGYQASPQDRFLIMAAEMEQSNGISSTELAQFWKDLPRNKIFEHRLRCHVLLSTKQTAGVMSNNSLESTANHNEDLQSTLVRVLASSSRLEQKLERCLWMQKVLMLLASILMALCFSCFYLLFVEGRTF